MFNSKHFVHSCMYSVYWTAGVLVSDMDPELMSSTQNMSII